MINISDLLQASDCYSQEVTVWVGLHRWRPFLVNIHIKISLGSFLVSFFFFLASFSLYAGGFALLLAGRQHLYSFAGSLWGLSFTIFTRICNLTETRVSTTSSCLHVKLLNRYHLENFGSVLPNSGDVAGQHFSSYWSKLWARFACFSWCASGWVS